MAVDEDVRLGRIADKLAMARAMPELLTAFGVEGHEFVLEPPATEAAVSAFEARHEVALPAAYRLFLTELGDGGAGPGYGLGRLAALCDRSCHHPGHLAQASPYLPGRRYLDDWEQRHEDPPSPDRLFMPGTLQIVSHGCSLATRLVVTGPARGRLINLDYDGPLGPYVVEDADFLTWYERWLDELVAGFDMGWFGERLPLDQPDLITVLTDDPSPHRRLRAGESLMQQPKIGEAAWTALAHAVTADPDPTVRAALLHDLTEQRRDERRRPDPASADANEVARYARSCDPPGLEALAIQRVLTLDDIVPELDSGDLERSRYAAYILGRDFPWTSQEKVLQELLDSVARRLLADPDPLTRSHGVVVVNRFDLDHLHPMLRESQECESDPWVLHYIDWCLTRKARLAAYSDDPWAADPLASSNPWESAPPF
ncbi:hypothetical protein AB0B66_22300 [Catellatospora sp. NPDC049111]|uniref:hypothetical protein n=1 Tax=Catellatospora sp. NPDC049111 TaxID=3155271 RepID=UPI0034016066